MKKALRLLVVMLVVVVASASPVFVDGANACSSWTIITYYDETGAVIGERSWSCSAGADADGGWGETSRRQSVLMGLCHCEG
jgi:hypothetical protein